MAETIENKIKKHTKNLLNLLGIEIQEADLEKKDEYWHLRINCGEKNALLIGRHGVTIDSLQLILRFLVNQETEDWQKIILDVDGYREKQKKRLAEKALETAHKVEMSGRPIVLANLSPYERRIIHITLSDNPNVSTRSEGEKGERRLIVEPK